MLEVLLVPAAIAIAALLAGGGSDDSSDGADGADDSSDGGTPPQGSVCPRTGTAYNAGLFPDPRSVQQELKLLGFALSLGWTNIQGADWRKEVMRFQAIARSMALPGMSTAPPSAVDGIVGACTLLALEDARKRRLAGVWPYALVKSTLGTGGTASSGPSEQQISMALDGTNPWAMPAVAGLDLTEQGQQNVPPPPPTCEGGMYPILKDGVWQCPGILKKEKIPLNQLEIDPEVLADVFEGATLADSAEIAAALATLAKQAGCAGSLSDPKFQKCLKKLLKKIGGD